MRAVIIMIVSLFLPSCENDSCRETSIPQQEINITVERLEKELFRKKSAKEVEAFLKENRSFSRYFLDSDQYPHDSILAAKLFELTNNVYIDTLYKETMNAFQDFSSIEADLEDAVGRMKSLFPDMDTPLVQTAVTGLYNDLIISDSLIVIGLDYFLGLNGTYKPQDIPVYILKRYDARHMPSTIVKFLCGPRIQKGGKETLLSEMIDFGKTYYLMSRLLPCTPDSLIIGFTPNEMKSVRENQAIIWANFVENEILYETSHIMKRKFLSERPNVYEISRDCPGRVGAWVGWEIVESYMANQQVTVKELIAETDHDKIFQLSGYKPRN